jgi:hypothetical protein
LNKKQERVLLTPDLLPKKQFVRIPSAALLAECSESKIRRMLETRQLKTYKLGRCTLVSVAELLGQIEAA